jgi:hypothetical protein
MHLAVSLYVSESISYLQEMKQGPVMLAVTLLFCAIAVVLFFRLNPNECWIHPEATEIEVFILKEIPLTLVEVLRNSFNFPVFEFAERVTRPASSIFEIIDTHARAWLWQYIQPHPSFSLTYFFTLILNPILLFKLLRRFEVRREIALLTVAIYLVQPGTSSLITMLFRPAKALVNFFILLCTHLALSSIRGKNKEPFFLGLCIATLCAFFCDETAILMFIALPVCFGKELFSSRKRIALFALIPIVLGVLYFVVFPLTARLAGFGAVNLADYEVFSSFRLWRLTPVGLFRSTLVTSAVALRASLGLFFPWDTDVIPALAMLCTLGLTLMACGLFFLRGAQTPQTQPLFSLLAKRGVFISLAFLGIPMLLTSNQPTGRVWTNYWYGTHLSIFLPLFLAWFLSRYRSKWAPILFCAGLLLNTSVTFRPLNRAYRWFHYYPRAPEALEEIFSGRVNRFALRTQFPSFTDWIEKRPPMPIGREHEFYAVSQELQSRAH